MKLKKTERAAAAAALVLVLAAAALSAARHGPPAEFVLRPAAQQSAALQPEEEAQRVDINRADRETLCTLDGIGEVLAERIIAYRTEHGAFADIEEITEVQGIGKGTLDRIRERITVG